MDSLEPQSVPDHPEINSFVATSLEAMRKKLLDLTSRNRLLSFPITGKGAGLRIVDELPDQLFATLVNEQEMQFAPVPEPTHAQLVASGYLAIGPDKKEIKLKAYPSAKEWAGCLGIKNDFELPTGEGEFNPAHEDACIQVMMYPSELEAHLRALHNKAQTALEESGAGILYLALGFLEWFESDDSDKARLALMPIS